MKRLVPIIFIALLLAACQLPQAPTGPEPDFNREDFQHLPQEIQDWVENTRDMHLAHSKIHQGRRYILASFGEMPTGGYEITIDDVEIGPDKITVTINQSMPNPGQAEPQVLTYPWDMVSVARLDLPLEFKATGDLEYILTLVGDQELPQITARSREIKIFSPAPGSTVPQSFSVEGIANVFEGYFSYLLRDADGTPTEEQNARAGMGDWYPFQLDVTAPDTISQEFTLELFSYSARDGDIINLVEVPLKRGQ